jgi:hypothetical protein
MLNRNDLAKQFELVVKQEIKNYQDSLNFVLQSIRELKESVEHVHQEQLENYAVLHSSYVGLQGDLSAVKNLIFSYGIKFDKFQREQNNLNDSSSKNISDIGEIIQDKINNENILKSEIEDITQKFSALREAIESIDNKYSGDINNISYRYQRDIQKTKEEILNAPTKADVVKKELSEKLDSHKVDVAGIMRELNIFKKENHITQKKIENIYILIERLQKSEGSK